MKRFFKSLFFLPTSKSISRFVSLLLGHSGPSAFSPVIYFYSLVPANYTSPAAVAPNQTVFGIEFMAIIAMCSFCVFCPRADTSKDVFSMSNCLKMVRIYAGPISTKMVNYLTFRNAAFFKLIRKTMGKNSFIFSKVRSISLVGNMAFPIPAIIRFINFFPKLHTLRYSNSDWRSARGFV